MKRFFSYDATKRVHNDDDDGDYRALYACFFSLLLCTRPFPVIVEWQWKTNSGGKK